MYKNLRYSLPTHTKDILFMYGEACRLYYIKQTRQLEHSISVTVAFKDYSSF